MAKIFLRGWSACLALAASAVFAQTPDPNATPKPAGLTFEVATIKPAPPLTPALVASGKLHAGMSVDGARLDMGFFSLSDMIRTAYKLKAYQLSGPDWLSAQRFDLLAKMPEGATKEQVPEMLQALLADRFKLTTHRDTKEHSVYALIVSKTGLKMKEAPDAPAPPEADKADKDDKKGFVVGAGSNQVRVNPNSDGKGATVTSSAGAAKMSMGPGGTMHMEFQKMAMEALVEMVGRFVDRPVIDDTGLKGNFEVALDLSMDDIKAMAAKSGMAGMMGMGMGADAARPPADAASEPTSSIFTALQAMGLRLESRKAPIEILVIDHAEKMPTEN